jgi:hypothetical protein
LKRKRSSVPPKAINKKYKDLYKSKIRPLQCRPETRR